MHCDHCQLCTMYTALTISKASLTYRHFVYFLHHPVIYHVQDHIERETMADTNAILERLRSAEALKQASLSQRVNDVSAELSSLDKIAKQVAGVTALADTNGYVPPASR
jgi:hypothetical protein